MLPSTAWGSVGDVASDVRGKRISQKVDGGEPRNSLSMAVLARRVSNRLRGEVVNQGSDISGQLPERIGPRITFCNAGSGLSFAGHMIRSTFG